VASLRNKRCACSVFDADIPLLRETRLSAPNPIRIYFWPPRRARSDIRASVVVGDSVWDLLAARRAVCAWSRFAFRWYGQDELERAGAYRVYQDLSTCCNTSMRLGSGPGVTLMLTIDR